MKILMLGWELPPHNAGGLGVACYHLCKALAENGADIDFIVPYTADHSSINFMNVISAIPADVKEVHKYAGAYDSFKFVDEHGNSEWININDYHRIYEKSIHSIIRSAEYDVIHAFDWLTIRPALRAKQLTGKPLIVNIHALEFDRSGGRRGNPYVWDIEYQGMMMADRVVTVSEYTKKVIVQQYNIPEDKIEVVHNSFDITAYSMPDDFNSYQYIEKMHQNGYRTAMYVGRLTIQKGLYNLLVAFQKVVSKRPKSLLLFVGSGEQEIELLEQAAELGIGGNVIFAGFQRGKRWRDSFAVTDITVMPSISEPFGLTALESAAFGVPALVSKQSGVAEVLKSALRVDYWDTEQLANQITSVMNSDALAQQLSDDGLHEIERLTWNDSARKLLGIYSSQLPGVAI